MFLVEVANHYGTLPIPSPLHDSDSLSRDTYLTQSTQGGLTGRPVQKKHHDIPTWELPERRSKGDKPPNIGTREVVSVEASRPSRETRLSNPLGIGGYRACDVRFQRLLLGGEKDGEISKRRRLRFARAQMLLLWRRNRSYNRHTDKPMQTFCSVDVAYHRCLAFLTLAILTGERIVPFWLRLLPTHCAVGPSLLHHERMPAIVKHPPG